MSRSPQLVWFKRDLRVSDHKPLLEAAKRGPCLCLYIYEPEIMALEDFGAGHLNFINESLQSLDDALRALGASLTVKTGSAVDVLQQLHRQYNFEALYSHEETGNMATYRRDIAVKSWTKAIKLPWHEFRQFGVVRGLKNRDGWSGQWNAMMRQSVVPSPERVVNLVSAEPLILKTPDDFQLEASPFLTPQRGGSHRAHETLRSFLGERGETYQYAMSAPSSAIDACSRLSPYLAYGNISMRTVYQALQFKRASVRALKTTGRSTSSPWLKSLASFDKRLHWHCHFMQKLESQPSLEWQNMASVYDGLREDEFDASRFEKWCAGETGYPMVDACMRYLRHTGWINFRMRAMLVSFASYHLWLDWRPTSKFLATLFLDYEPGIHYSQFQMQSGTTGINSVRIYSPTKQVVDHDPEGHFIRQWVPELEFVPNKHIAEPSRMSLDEQFAARCMIGKDYPEPIVNHRHAVNAAKQRIYTIRRQQDAKSEAKAVFQRHGSRRGPMARRRG